MKKKKKITGSYLKYCQQPIAAKMCPIYKIVYDIKNCVIFQKNIIIKTNVKTCC